MIQKRTDTDRKPKKSAMRIKCQPGFHLATPYLGGLAQQLASEKTLRGY